MARSKHAADLPDEWTSVQSEKRTSAGTCQGQRNGSFTLVMYQSHPPLEIAKAKINLHSKEFKVRNKQKYIKMQPKTEQRNVLLIEKPTHNQE